MVVEYTTNSGFLDRDVAALIRDNAGELTSLGGNLLNAARGKDVRTILVTSSHPGEGKSVAAISIANTLANHIRSRVALLDANFYAPRLHELFHLQSEPGLADVLIEGLPYQQALYGTDQENLRVIPTGTALASTIGRHEVGALKGTLTALLEEFDYVIVDCCHFFDSSDVSLFASLFDGIILVIECEKTNWEVVQQVNDNLKNVGGQVLGAVLNKRRYYIPRKLYGKI
ncbi:MAG TPA: CpsD/CapB family tyrosine-protein kinase, partial [Candidatus Aminicenantes bacterium]|nr:CpsD/CapB family tyrosine-protein kinase [Candidatus Aminicenantes bacterium]